MKTKNAKRLWPVPATLAVVALAAFLAFGLMATPGVQLAAAQDDADCTVQVAANGDVMLPSDECSAVGDTAAIKFQGSAEALSEDRSVSLLIEDKNGPLTIYPNNADWSTNLEPDGIATMPSGTTAAEPKKYRFQVITLVERFLNDDGIFEGNAVTIMVQGNVLVWEGQVNTHLDIADIPDDNSLDGARALASDSETLEITFLGMPALGEDADTDFNDKVDDDETVQCKDTDDDSDTPKIVDEVESGNCPAGMQAIAPNPDADVEESRSKLVAVTTADAATPVELLDGGELEIDMGAANGVRIYAVIEDKDTNELLDAEVTFSATETPSGIIAASDRMDEEDTEEFGTPVSAVSGIAETDAVATFTLDDLADVDGAYRITIELMVGSLDLGTVILKREGNPETIVAGVFNAACFTPGGDDADDYFAAFNDKNEGCTAMGDAMRFGAGEMIFVKAHLEDSLGSFVGDGTTLASELANEDDDLLGDADMLTIDDPVMENDPARAWVYTVDKDAMLGDHMITVSTTAQNADDEDIDDVTLTVSVAGPPTQYMFVDPVDNIELGDRAMFAVQAYDMEMGIPHFTTMDPGKNNTVDVVVPDIAESLVRGRMLDNGVLTLDADTGMGTFTIYAPSNAPDGSTARIFVSAGDVEITHTVTFGEAGAMPPTDGTTDPMDHMFTAMYSVMADSPSSGMVDVSWSEDAFDTDMVMLLQDGVVVMRMLSFNDENHTFSDVDTGTYQVVVYSFTSGVADGGMLAFGMVMVE